MLKTMPELAEFKAFYRTFFPLIDKYPRVITKETEKVIEKLKASLVYEFLNGNYSFEAAFKLFNSNFNYEQIFLGFKFETKEIHGDFVTLTLMGLFARAFAEFNDVKSIPKERIKTISQKTLNEKANVLDDVLQLVSDGNFFIPRDITQAQIMALGTLSKVLKDPNNYAVPRRETGKELLYLKHFIFNITLNLASLFGSALNDSQKIVLNLAYIISSNASYEESIIKWIRASFETHYSTLREYAFIRTDSFNLAKYGLLAELR